MTGDDLGWPLTCGDATSEGAHGYLIRKRSVVQVHLGPPWRSYENPDWTALGATQKDDAGQGSALVPPCDPRADPLTDRARPSRLPPLSYQPAGAVACAGVILREVSRTAAPAARERHPELVGRGP